MKTKKKEKKMQKVKIFKRWNLKSPDRNSNFIFQQTSESFWLTSKRSCTLLWGPLIWRIKIQIPYQCFSSLGHPPTSLQPPVLQAHSLYVEQSLSSLHFRQFCLWCLEWPSLRFCLVKLLPLFSIILSITSSKKATLPSLRRVGAWQ